MSHSTETSNLTAEQFDPAAGKKLSSLSFAISAIGLLVSVYGLLVSREQFAFSWLFGFVLVFTLCAGALFWTILHHATDSEWGILVRRQMENVAGILPALSVFFPTPADFLRSNSLEMVGQGSRGGSASRR